VLRAHSLAELVRLGTRYHLKLWIGLLDESAAYLPA
jgi:hypothetical protein